MRPSCALPLRHHHHHPIHARLGPWVIRGNENRQNFQTACVCYRKRARAIGTGLLVWPFSPVPRPRPEAASAVRPLAPDMTDQHSSPTCARKQPSPVAVIRTVGASTVRELASWRSPCSCPAASGLSAERHADAGPRRRPTSPLKASKMLEPPTAGNNYPPYLYDIVPHTINAFN